MARPAALVFRDNPAALATCRELGRAGVEVVVLDAERGPASSSRFARFVEAPSYYDDPAAWAAFMATHPRGVHGTVEYDLAQFGLSAAEIRRACQFYIDRFGVTLESTAA